MTLAYVRENSYASPTSYGFSNTWQVLVFQDSESADRYVADSPKRGTARITLREVPEYHGQTIRPFSGEYLAVVDYDPDPPQLGYLGTIETQPRGSSDPRLTDLQELYR